jgi:Cys-tRNA(Pro)/Cys-tRNA(Cys) deacylase
MPAHPKIEQQLKLRGVNHNIREHGACSVPIHSPADFARALGYPLERITKSLLVRGQVNERFVVAVCSANKKLDLAGIAKLLDCGRLELAPAEELRVKTGYPPTGVSPLGLDSIDVIVDEALLTYETILVGGGVVGTEVELAPSDVIACSGAIVAKIVR